MITILPADERAYRQIGITDPTLRAMVLVNGETIESYILFRIDGEEMELLSIPIDDLLLQEGLVRAALNYGARRAVETAFCTNAALYPVLDILNFSVDGNRRTVSVSEFFSRGCVCCPSS